MSAHGIIPGNKKAPHKVKKGAVQVDGMALEFNIEPASNYRQFSGNITAVLEQLRSMVPEDLQFQVTPVAHFTEEYLKSQPEEATELGCEPDYNAWTGQVNPTPDATRTFRTASGHIHIGWTEGMDIRDPDHIEACEMLVKQLDYTVGIMSLVWDPDHQRRQLYGMPGAYRPKPYGVEYRVLSNMWLKDNLYRKIVWAGVKFAFDSLLKGERLYKRRTMHENIPKFATGDSYLGDLNIVNEAIEVAGRLYYNSYITKSEHSKFRALAEKFRSALKHNQKEVRWEPVYDVFQPIMVQR